MTCRIRPQNAFTLIELLVVVAIIAILAAIALPNFLEAQARAKVSRAKADLRTGATAVELYAVDHNAYPLAITIPPQINTIEDRWAQLTTPIAYLNAIPVDPFGDRFTSVSFPGPPGRYRTFDFLTRLTLSGGPNPITHEPFFDFMETFYGISGQWYAASQGPDGVADLTLGTEFTGRVYDPTNGTISDGDIIRMGPGIGQLE